LPETAGKPPTAKTTFNGINHECHYSRTITTEETPATDGKATTEETETIGMLSEEGRLQEISCLPLLPMYVAGRGGRVI
jgi:hypothetical protein